MQRLVSSLVGLATLCLWADAMAVPTTISFEGRLSTANGPVTGTVDLRFGLYDQDVGGTEVWNESRPAVPASDGLVFVDLGAATSLDEAVLDGGPLFLEIKVSGETLSPRLPIQSVPYAIRSSVSDTADSLGTITPDQVVTAVTGAGGVTAVRTGNAVALGIDTAALQRRVTGTCGTDQAIKSISATGTVTCETDDDTTYTATAPLALSGTSLRLGTCPANQVYKMNAAGSAWTCAADANSGGTLATVSGGSGITATTSGSTATVAVTGGGITATHLASGAVTSAKIAGGAVTSTELASGAVTSVKIASGAVGNAALAAAAVTGAKIATGTITDVQLASGAVTSVKIADGAVTMAKTDAPVGTMPAADGGAGDPFPTAEAPSGPHRLILKGSFTPSSNGACMLAVTAHTNEASASGWMAVGPAYQDSLGNVGKLNVGVFLTTVPGSTLYNASNTWVFPVVAGRTYQVGCAFGWSTGSSFADNTAVCVASWICN